MYLMNRSFGEANLAFCPLAFSLQSPKPRMDKFVQKKQKLDDDNLLKIERGDKLKEIAGLSLADYVSKWSERPNEIKLLHPRPGIINESAQVVFTREGRAMMYELYERKQSDAWKNVGDISRATGVKDAAVCLHDFAEVSDNAAFSCIRHQRL